MKKQRVVMVLAAVAFCLTGAMESVWSMGKPHSPTAPMAAPQEMTHYVCPGCHVMADMAGKCPKCGAEMVPMHVLAVKDSTAYCCGCPPGCTCKMVAGDMTKCSCGKDVVQVDIKGKYACPSNMCPSISDKPGKCPCGKDLVKVE